jgi:excisionase family DNA binding protein
LAAATSLTLLHQPLLLRVREVAAVLAVSERQVWNLIRAGELQAVHPPGMRAVRVLRDDVEALVNKWRGTEEHEPAEAL